VIVGILKESGGSDDSRIFMPIKNAVSILEDKDQKNFDSIIVKVNDISQTDDTVAQITSKLMLSHGILQSSKVDFSVTSLKSMQARVSTTLNSMSIFLGAIAAISLIVGAIGIMNSTFTSVLEKTREIGILKAIGARNKDILAIFLFNSAIIGFIGGVLGISFGIIASGFISELAGTASTGNMVSRFVSLTYVNPQLIVGVFLLSIGVGLLSGAIPAYRASRLKPVDALRYE
jgi:putative ABC transport system permease protein